MTKSAKLTRQASSLALAVGLLLAATTGLAANEVAINIQAQPLASALKALGEQSNLQLIFKKQDVQALESNALAGEMLPEEALKQMLAGTGFTYEFTAENMVVIKQSERTSQEAEKGKPINVKSIALEEVIVTAQKREENVQDVPAAISALSAEMLSDRGINSPQDLQFSVPGLTLGETTLGAANVTLRGVGTENTVAGGDPGVPLHVDGHYLQFTSYMLKDFFDVERVEVQRGPQGTLYGRNALGGNVNIITKRPTEQFEGNVSLDVGNYNKYLVQGVVSGPITDSLRGRAVVSKEKRDGFVTNITNGEDLLDSNYETFRASLEYDLTDNIEIFTSAYYYTDDSVSFVNRVVGDYPNVGVYSFIPYANISASDPLKVRTDVAHKGNDVAKGGALDISWDLGSATFKSLTAYNDAERLILQDLDASDLVVTTQTSILKSRTLSQELQLLSSDDSDLQWIMGLFYFEEKADYYFDINWTSTNISGSPFDSLFVTPANVDTTSVAAFGQLDYSLTDSLELTAGLRYTRDKKEMYRQVIVDVPGFFLVADSTLDDTWSQMSGKLGVNYHLDEDTLIYASYSLGFKAGGFNATSITEPSYDPELLDAYEVGLKGQFLDNRLQLNLSTFYYDYTDKVESKIAVPAGSNIAIAIFTNAGAASVVGVEFETQYYVTNSLLVDSSVAYQKAEYDEFNSIDPSNDVLGEQDLSGNTLTRSPEWKFHLGVQYEWLLSNGGLTARVDYSWIDEQYFRAFNLDTDKADSYHRTNARLQWENNNANWSIALYALNLENDHIISNQNVGSPALGFARYGSYLPPRTYGIKASYKF